MSCRFEWPLAVSSWSWHQPFYFDPTFTLWDVPGQAAAAGIPLVELNDFMLPPPRLSRVRQLWRPLWPRYPAAWWHYTRGNIGRLRARLEAAGVRCICWTLDTDFTGGAAAWRVQQRYIERGVWAAGRVGATHVRLTLSGKEEGQPAEIDGLIVERLIATAQRHPHIQFVVENHGGLTADIGRMVEIMVRVRRKAAVGVCFDPGNVAVEQRAEMWPALAAVATHFHLKTREFTAAGAETTIAYDKIFARLREHDYEGYIVIEFEGDGSPLLGISHSHKMMGQKKVRCSVIGR